MQVAALATADLLASGRGLSDEEVVARVRAGDTPLFELLTRRHNQRLYRAARSIVRHQAEVEDVLQEAYVSAFTHLDQFLGRARFSTWLTRIAVVDVCGLLGRRWRQETVFAEGCVGRQRWLGCCVLRARGCQELTTTLARRDVI